MESDVINLVHISST